MLAFVAIFGLLCDAATHYIVGHEHCGSTTHSTRLWCVELPTSVEGLLVSNQVPHLATPVEVLWREGHQEQDPWLDFLRLGVVPKAMLSVVALHHLQIFSISELGIPWNRHLFMAGIWYKICQAKQLSFVDRKGIHIRLHAFTMSRS